MPEFEKSCRNTIYAWAVGGGVSVIIYNWAVGGGVSVIIYN